MRKLAVAVMAAGLAAFAWADAKPATLRIVGENMTAHLSFEKGGKVMITSKPAPIKPDTYWTNGLSLFKQDDKGKTWELRCNGAYGSLANVTIEAAQDKVLLLGKSMALVVEGKPAEEPQGSGNRVLAVSIFIRGMDSEAYLPWAFDGKSFTMPNVAIKDEAGKVLASGRCEVRDGRYAWFTWKCPAGWEAKYDVEVQAFLGPFECKLAKTTQSMKRP